MGLGLINHEWGASLTDVGLGCQANIGQSTPKIPKTTLGAENKTVWAWLPKADKQLVRENPHTKGGFEGSAHLKYCPLWDKGGIGLAIFDTLVSHQQEMRPTHGL